MHQFFVEKSQVGKEYVTITGSDVNHIRNVLRMKIGETIRISDREGGNYFCKIAETGENFVQADIVSVDEEGTELPSKIYLFQALPKGDRMETVIEKAIEAGRKKGSTTGTKMAGAGRDCSKTVKAQYHSKDS